MQQARLDTPRFFSLYDESLLLSPRVRILDSVGTVLSTLSLSISALSADLYLSGEGYTFTRVGVYSLVFEQSDGGGGFLPVAIQQLTVGMDPVSDFVVSVVTPQTFRLDEAVVGDAISTVTLRVLRQDGTEHTAAPEAVPFDVGEDNYKVTLTDPLDEEEAYHFLWYDDGVIVLYEQKLGFVERGLQLVKLLLEDTSGGPAVAYSGTTVLLSDSDGTPVKQSISSGDGEVDFHVAPGTYIVTLNKSGVFFNRNNSVITVVNTQLVTGTNRFVIDVESFTPTFTPEVDVQPTCTLSATLLDFTGKPMRCTEVVVELSQGPENFSGVGAFGTYQTYQTDQNGYVSFKVLRNIVVTVTFMTHGYRRKFAVPDQPTANLLTLMAGAEDLFDVVRVSIPAAVRRSL